MDLTLLLLKYMYIHWTPLGKFKRTYYIQQLRYHEETKVSIFGHSWWDHRQLKYAFDDSLGRGRADAHLYSSQVWTSHHHSSKNEL